MLILVRHGVVVFLFNFISGSCSKTGLCSLVVVIVRHARGGCFLFRMYFSFCPKALVMLTCSRVFFLSECNAWFLPGVGGPERQDREGPDLASLRHVSADLWVQPRRADHLRWSHPQVTNVARLGFLLFLLYVSNEHLTPPVMLQRSGHSRHAPVSLCYK